MEVKNLTKYFALEGGVFGRRKREVKAVDGIGFVINEKETFGLVGESGCGKTTTGKCVLRLIEPTGGQVFFQNRDILRLEKNEMKKLRANMQLVFQNPYSSLSPRMTIGESIRIPLRNFKICEKSEVDQMVLELIQSVGLEPEHLDRYPHELSGGQRQRVAIARALASAPKFVVLDEPTSSLDLSVQAKLLNVLANLQEKLKAAYLYISHNLDVVRLMCDRTAVMYLGKIVEIASTDELFKSMLHPYTAALLSAIPIPDPDVKKERILLNGELPSAVNPPVGCHFHNRCPHAISRCSREEPNLTEVRRNHFAACHII